MPQRLKYKDFITLNCPKQSLLYSFVPRTLAVLKLEQNLIMNCFSLTNIKISLSYRRPTYFVTE